MFGVESPRKNRPGPKLRRVRSDVFFRSEPRRRNRNFFWRRRTFFALGGALRHSDEEGLWRDGSASQPNRAGNLVVLLNERVQVSQAALELRKRNFHRFGQIR